MRDLTMHFQFSDWSIKVTSYSQDDSNNRNISTIGFQYDPTKTQRPNEGDIIFAFIRHQNGSIDEIEGTILDYDIEGEHNTLVCGTFRLSVVNIELDIDIFDMQKDLVLSYKEEIRGLEEYIKQLESKG